MTQNAETYLYKKENKTQTKLNLWMAYPGIKSFGMASLGYLTVFKTIDTIDGIFAERIFTDTKDTRIKLQDVDVFGFSFSFELDILCILKLLKQYNIPFKNTERNSGHPLIYGGGPVLTANPEPFAPFFDFIMIGDIEPIGKQVFQYIRDNKEMPRNELLSKLAKFEGIYVPSLTKFDEKQNKVLTLDNKEFKVKKISAELSECTYTPILSKDSYFSNTFIVEIERGCPQRCGFCLASYLNLPTRCCSIENLIKTFELGLKYTNKIALLGALVCGHPDFDKICDFFIKKIDNGENIELTISSLRADYVSPKTIEMLVKSGQRTATIAVEAGSERLRKIINKNLSEKEIMDVVKIAEDNGLKGLKMYAMIGLPTETYDDLDELVALIKRIKTKHKTFDITLGFSTFVPKAQTPFQYAQREDTKSLEKKYEYLKKEFHKIGVKIRTSSVKWDYIQALLSRGDRRLCDYLISVFESECNLGAFKKSYKELKKSKNLPSSDYYALEEKSTDKNLPWDFIENFISNKDLADEYNRLLRLF